MKGYCVYNKIQQLKAKGFKRAAVAKRLNIDRRTVGHYWNMSVDEFEAYLDRQRRESSLDRYKQTIFAWLREYPTLSAAQVCDWLKEHYSASYSERTVSRYVKKLRQEYNLKKSQNPRDYEAVPELPPGQQVQVDFGQIALQNVEGGTTKVYVAAFLLSHSRYKYAECQSRPFTTVDLVKICHNCFRYFGGMPQEMVFDQDNIVCVSENAGEIIYTYEFEKFRQECKVSVYMCRGADPESKGKIENTVKYIKGNFLRNRMYVDDSILNYSCLEWLERTANKKVHGTTKRVPAEVFQDERNYLRPLVTGDLAEEPHICRTVRKDNTVIYDSNRYSVPLGTYNSQPEVKIVPKDGILRIETVYGDYICEHRIASGRGLLIQNKSHTRDRSTGLDKMQADLEDELQGQANEFLQAIRTEKSRYARDQFKLVQTMIDQYGIETVLKGIGFFTYSRIYSANTLKDYLTHEAENAPPQITFAPDTIPVDDPKYHVTTQKRSLEIYAKVGVAR